MQIWINGQRYEWESEKTVWQILEELNFPKQGIAVEVNRKIVPKSEYKSFVVKEGDRMEIVHPVGGG